MPRITGAYEVIGNITEEVADETGLSSSSIVVAGSGDMLASLYTSGLCEKGNLVDSTGTGSIICYFDDEPIIDPKVMNLRHVLDGWVPFGNIDSSGCAFRWFRDNLSKEETKVARNNGIDEYKYLCDIAGKTPVGADGLLFFPYLMGERTMGNANSRGTFIGLNLGTQMGHLVRSVLEGIAFEHKRTIDIFESTGKKIIKFIILLAVQKVIFGIRLKLIFIRNPFTLQFDEGGVLGAAILGGFGAGLYKNPVEVAKNVLKI